MIFSSYADQKDQLVGIRLVSCGHIFAKPGREICRPNGRSDWLLFYVSRGQETFFLDRPVIARAGSFILFAPGEKQHHIYQGDKTAEFYYIHFKCDALPRQIALETSRVYSPSNQKGVQKGVTAVFDEIIEETLQKKLHYEALCITLLLQLLVVLQREVAQSADADPTHQHPHRVARAIQHMNRYCDSNLKLEEYAAMCCMSKYHFLRVFKQETGETPLEYRSRVRIEHAKELLESSYLSVAEISATLGYTAPSYFSDAFRRAVGVSPKEYRK